MFKRNEAYLQYNMFGVEQYLTAKQSKTMYDSVEHTFFEEIFKNIDEDHFSVLYSDKKSRPNVPVNRLVGSLILKHLYDWSYSELFKNLTFNLLTRHAIGVQGLNEDVFAEASIFNFQNRIIDHYVKTGEDLLVQVFDQLTDGQLEKFGVDTQIQRGDSFLIGSNIFDYSRLQLLIEVLLRMIKSLSPQQNNQVNEFIAPYLKTTAGQYIYKVARADLPHELNELAKVYFKLHSLLEEDHGDTNVFKVFERVYLEHFVILDNKIEVIDSADLTSGILMSPDDQEATFRKKGKQNSKGFVGHLSETADSDNQINLITDIEVRPNNIGDAEILENRLPKMIEKTPELSEYFMDGLYGSPANDLLMSEFEITPYQTSIRGRKSNGMHKVDRDEQGTVYMSCGGGQRVRGIKNKRWKAVFNYSICAQCPLLKVCGALTSGLKRGVPKKTYYFEDKDILGHERAKNISKLPKKKQKTRANVEASVKEVKRGMNNGKVRVRGQIKTRFYLAFTAIAVNLTRIHRVFCQRTKLCTVVCDRPNYLLVYRHALVANITTYNLFPNFTGSIIACF